MKKYSNFDSEMEAGNHFIKNLACAKSVIFKRILQAFLVFILLSFTHSSLAQTQAITEENYRRALEAIETEFDQEMQKLSEYAQNHPEKRDSLFAVWEQLIASVEQKSAEALIKHASAFDVPNFLEQLYRLRLNAPKDAIRDVLITLSENEQSLPYAQSLKYHVETQQITVGSGYYDFQATDAERGDFIFSSLKGKNILLLYGGLDCMGAQGRNDLNKLYNTISQDSFEIVVFCGNSSNLESLQGEREKYQQSLPFDYYLVSDFMRDHSKMKILYGAQATPTAFLINDKGIVVMKTMGFDYEQVIQILNELQ